MDTTGVPAKNGRGRVGRGSLQFVWPKWETPAADKNLGPVAELCGRSFVALGPLGLDSAAGASRHGVISSFTHGLLQTQRYARLFDTYGGRAPLDLKSARTVDGRDVFGALGTANVGRPVDRHGCKKGILDFSIST